MLGCKCYGCTKRFVGCHSQCEDYKNYRLEVDEKNKFLLKESSFNGYSAEQKFYRDKNNFENNKYKRRSSAQS